MAGPINMLCLYRVKPGKEEAFKALLMRHCGVLRQEALATSQPAQLEIGSTKDGKQTFIEKFQWMDENSPGLAHRSAEVQALWGPMAELVDGMEFLALRPVDHA